MKKIILIIFALCVIAGSGYSQAPVKRQKKEKTEQPKTSESLRKQQSGAKRKTPSDARISDPDGYISDHGYVDLGLPSGLKWATCNVGASLPSDYCAYYQWGETEVKSSIGKDGIQADGKSISELRSAGIIESTGNLTMSHDAARANWGGSWRMPTQEELKELQNKCTWTWTSHGGHDGFKVIGPNGRSIFLPADSESNQGRYWSSTPGGSDGDLTGCLEFHGGPRFTSSGSRYVWTLRRYRLSIRPVSE